MKMMKRPFFILVLFLLTSNVVFCERCSRVTQTLQCGDLACDTDRGVCVLCNTSADCYPSAMQCKEGKCVVKSFVSNFSALYVVALLCSVAVCSIAVLAGVGGGGILVPMFCLLMGLPMDFAVGLSQSTICGQSILNVLIAIRKRFPCAGCSRPLINYQYLTLLVPLGVIGTLIGGVLNRLCPDLFRLVLLFLLLTTVLYRSVRKMIAQYRKDQSERRGTNTVSSAEEVSGTSTLDSPEEILHVTQPQYPWIEISCVVFSFIVNLSFGAWRSRTKCGGGAYIVAYCLPVLLNIVIFFCYRHRLSNMEKFRLVFHWSNSTTILYPLVSVVAGVASAMLGIGGGLVLGFILYDVGLIPEEASVTGGVVTLFLAFSSALSLLIESHLLIDYGGVLFACGIVSTILGQFVLMRIIKKYKLRFLIIAALVTIIAGSLTFLTSYGIYSSLNLTRSGGSIIAFGRLCRAKGGGSKKQ
ncbi:hypothetical protein TcBrA4_0105070 [Trypanosoma cruzi]|nr:hypothetical protein TcBrA4_0105070 [Trypanosoma cruzi]